MDKKQELYDEMSRVLTDYEMGEAGEVELYEILVKLQCAWDAVLTAQD